MTLDEIKDGDYFEFKDRVLQKTDRVCGYKIVCVCLYNGCDILLERGTEVKPIEEYLGGE